MITVRVGRLPGRLQEIVLDGGTRVTDALTAADENPHGATILVNSEGKRDDEDSILYRQLEEGDVVTLSKQIKGN